MTSPSAPAGGGGRRWHAAPVEELSAAMGSDLSRGLAATEAAARLERDGPNEIPEGERRPLWRVFVRQFASPLVYLLLGAAAIAFLIDSPGDAAVILAVVLLNALIGAFQEGRAEHSLAALRKLGTHRARVRRDGRDAVVEARDVVAGDLLLLEAGDAVAADARLVESAALRVAEAALTGESVPVEKEAATLPAETSLSERSNCVHAGTLVTGGRGCALVFATGSATEIGAIAALTRSAEEPPTPLERRIAAFGRAILVAASVLFVAITAIGAAHGLPLAEIVMVGVSQLVGMIPEGLPVAVTITQAVGVQRMARRRALVRRLAAVETLGSTTVICTDKTGTLTRNEMTVTTVRLADGRELAVGGSGYEPRGELRDGERAVTAGDDPALAALVEAVVLCGDARLRPPDAGDPRWRPIGDPTEVALLTLAAKAGVDATALRASRPRRGEIPFDSGTKLMATAHGEDGAGTVFVKGAPEALLPLCGAVRRGERDEPIDEDGRRAVAAASTAMADRALRVLAVAAAPWAELDPAAGYEPLRGRAVLLGLVGQIDPPRTEVREAVERCRDAGIRTVMVTGDHVATGTAIARELGISRPGDVAVRGDELERLSDAELDERLGAVSVFARVRPAQKLRIVGAYQRRGEIVAMTGDGVNDAPALARADVGVAMGITGTEVAKEAAKIVIGDDDFATIVAAVEEGRVVYRNIKKAILLLFSTSVAEVAVLLLALLIGYPPPFAAVQILWNNLVTEGVIVVNLAMEPPEGDEMRQPPAPRDEPLVTRPLLARAALMAGVIVACTLGWFAWRTAAGVGVEQVRTETFTLLAICEWFNVLNCRSETRSGLSLAVLGNPWLVAGLVAGNVLQILVVFWEPLGRHFHTVPFGIEQVVLLGVVGSAVLWVEEARKLAARTRGGGMPPGGAAAEAVA